MFLFIIKRNSLFESSIRIEKKFYWSLVKSDSISQAFRQIIKLFIYCTYLWAPWVAHRIAHLITTGIDLLLIISFFFIVILFRCLYLFGCNTEMWWKSCISCYGHMASYSDASYARYCFCISFANKISWYWFRISGECVCGLNWYDSSYWSVDASRVKHNGEEKRSVRMIVCRQTRTKHHHFESINRQQLPYSPLF